MNILITGGLGFIGGEMVQHFLKEGNAVSIIDKNIYSENLISNHNRLLQCRTYIGRVENINKHPIITDEHFDLIIHCAAQTAVTKSLSNPKEDFYSNAAGTFEVCEKARKDDAMVLFCSTNKVYSEHVNGYSIVQKPTRYEFTDSGFGVDENCPIGVSPLSPYGVSKLSGDLYTQEYNKTYGLNTVVFRLSCIYGASQRGTEDQGWVSHFVKTIMSNGRLNIYGDGKQVRDVLYVDDLVNLFDKAVKMGKPGVFNVGGGVENTISLLELIKEVYNNTDKKEAEIMFEPWRTADQKVYISNINKVSEFYGWKPSVSPSMGIKKLIEREKRKLS